MEIRALCFKGVAGTLEIKRLPDMVVTVVVIGTWETHDLKAVSGKVSFAVLPIQDLEIYLFSSPLNRKPCCASLEQSIVVF